VKFYAKFCVDFMQKKCVFSIQSGFKFYAKYCVHFKQKNQECRKTDRQNLLARYPILLTVIGQDKVSIRTVSPYPRIFEVLIRIRAHFLGGYLVLIDSMSSLKALQTQKVARRTHSLVYEIKEAYW
jgi:hypothetical protein